MFCSQSILIIPTKLDRKLFIKYLMMQAVLRTTYIRSELCNSNSVVQGLAN